MGKKEGTKAISFTIDADNLEWLDRTAERFGKTRSQALNICIEIASDDLAFIDHVGLKPERIKSVLEFLGVWRRLCPDELVEKEKQWIKSTEKRK